MYRNKIDFCVLSCDHVVVLLDWSELFYIDKCVHRGSFISPFPTYITFISFSCLIALGKTSSIEEQW